MTEKSKKNLTEKEILALLGTDPREWIRLVSAANLVRVIPLMFDANLARLIYLLSDANLARVKKIQEVIKNAPLVVNLYTKMKAAVKGGAHLNMETVHVCETTHCAGGWTVHLAGEAGYDLEKKYGWKMAAMIIHKRSRPDAPFPFYYASDDAAMAYIDARAEEETKIKESGSHER